MRRIERRKDLITTMTNAEATQDAAAVAEQGATIAPETASSKIGSNPSCELGS
jgi:hypothetical protein